MAKIVWLDLEGKRHKPRKEFSDIRSFRSYIKKNMANIKIVELLDCSGLNTLYDESTESGLFKYCYNLVKVENVIGTSDIENMAHMFFDCNNLKSVPYFDTFNVTRMSCMFNRCWNLESVPHFDTSRVENINFMFNRCYSLKCVPLLDISNVTLMESVLYECDNLKSYTLPCDEYTTRSMAVKAYKGKEMLDMWDKLFE